MELHACCSLSMFKIIPFLAPMFVCLKYLFKVLLVLNISILSITIKQSHI